MSRDQSLLDPQTVCFLNQRARIDDPSIWNDARYDKLWLYNLHYFDDLNAQGADERIAWHRELIERWIAENPPGYGNGWEPYPTSLRIVNWVKWLQAGNLPTENMVDSLATQARWLRRRLEYHILGNHLLANAKALWFSGLFFSEREADRWQRKGLAILRCEIPEQILPDGGHFERSPMYHLLVLEDLLDLINLHRRYEAEIPQQWHDAATSMLQWSAVMRHPDGEIPFFNDAAFGIAPGPEAIDEYAKELGFVLPQRVQAPLTHLARTGYARLQQDNAVLFVDAAPIGPDYLLSHAHADTLSFELSLGDQRVVVNGGTSLYGVSEERDCQRGSKAHSTAIIDDIDSSEVWAGFRVARRTNVTYIEASKRPGRSTLRAAHNGYSNLPGKPQHHRNWSLADGCLQISDYIGGTGYHKVDVLFLLHPNAHAHLVKVDLIHIDLGNGQLAFLESDPYTALHIDGATWHPRFGCGDLTTQIRLSWRGWLPTSLTSLFRWNVIS